MGGFFVNNLEFLSDFIRKINRRRPTLASVSLLTTIDAGGLNCRGRNGNGCFPTADATDDCLV